MKKLVFIGTIVAILVIGGVVIAKGVERSPATIIPSGRTVIVPDKAIDNSPVLVEKAIFIHYRKGFAKPGTECGNGVCEPSENAKKCPEDCKAEENGAPKSKCYGILSKGAKLKSAKDLTIHSDLDLSAILNSAEEWDSNTPTSLFSDYTVDVTADWDSDAPDGRNEFSFGDYPQSGVIAVAVVWGYFSGPPQLREIVEFDVLFDTDFVWGDAAVDPAVMDLQNIATHEIGHGVGLDDIYKTACKEVTMYGYSDYEETKKRTLEQPDIIGLQKLYGN